MSRQSLVPATIVVLLCVSPTCVNAIVRKNDALTLQVTLDRAGFSPGVIDGSMGRLTHEAIKGFQEAKGITVTGSVDSETKAALDEPAAATVTVEVTDTGPFLAHMPETMADKAKLPRLDYTSAEEAIAERYHTTPAMLRTLNPGTDFTAGKQITVPAIVLAGASAGATEWEATLDKLGVDKNQPSAAKVVVDKSERNVRVFDSSGKLLALFPATIGSRHDPLPLGTWKIRGVAKLPAFNYNPELFWDAGPKDAKAKLPPGPNSPVGVAWIDLSKEHYGIHGTPEPATVSQTTSHGCIRLTNWDVAKLAQMVRPGTPVILQE